MTRDEAARILQNRHWNNPLAFVDSLEALGLLKLETTDKDCIAAVDVLRRAGYMYSIEMVEELKKAGFKITKEPT
jgi:hypothetical protein